MNDRIRLAEAMGWKLDIVTTNPITDEPIESWNSPDGEISRFSPPDPFTDANDCEALIHWLADEKHITVTVTFGRGVRFDHYIGTKAEIESDDWKRAVCQGVLEVIE